MALASCVEIYAWKVMHVMHSLCMFSAMDSCLEFGFAQNLLLFNLIASCSLSDEECVSD